MKEVCRERRAGGEVGGNCILSGLGSGSFSQEELEGGWAGGEIPWQVPTTDSSRFQPGLRTVAYGMIPLSLTSQWELPSTLPSPVSQAVGRICL